METTIKLPKELASELNEIVLELGFNENSEFIEQAIKEKILEFKKRKFIEISNKIASNLKKNRISQVKILEDFEKFENEN